VFSIGPSIAKTSKRQVLQAKREEIPAQVEAAQPKLAGLVKWCWSHEADSRPSAGEVAEALAEFDAPTSPSAADPANNSDPSVRGNLDSGSGSPRWYTFAGM